MNIQLYIFNICKIFVIILQTQKRIIWRKPDIT